MLIIIFCNIFIKSSFMYVYLRQKCLNTTYMNWYLGEKIFITTIVLFLMTSSVSTTSIDDHSCLKLSYVRAQNGHKDAKCVCFFHIASPRLETSGSDNTCSNVWRTIWWKVPKRFWPVNLDSLLTYMSVKHAFKVFST